MTKIRVLRRNFQQLKAQHIYRVYNKEADQLSNKDFLLDENGIYYAMDTEGQPEKFERLDINH